MTLLQNILQVHRKQKNLSQGELAHVASLTQAMISKIESGKDVRLSTLEAVAKALGLKIIAVTPEQDFHLKQLMHAQEKNFPGWLEKIQVKDDE